MSVGMLFLLASFLIFFLLGVGVPVLPRAEMFAAAAAVLGLILAGIPWPPWPHR